MSATDNDKTEDLSSDPMVEQLEECKEKNAGKGAGDKKYRFAVMLRGGQRIDNVMVQDFNAAKTVVYVARNPSKLDLHRVRVSDVVAISDLGLTEN
jgi:hypothetical protein